MNPLAFLSPYKLAAEIAVFGAIAAGTAFGAHQFLEHERDIGRHEVQARWDAQTAKDVIAGKIETDRLAKQAADAVTNGALRDQTIRTLSASSAAASGSLRDAIATAVSGSMSSNAVDALRDTTRALGAISVECQARRGEMAESFERVNSEKSTLMDAWPR